MSNAHVAKRLEAIMSLFRAVDAGGSTLSSASMGSEREFFINHVLCNVIAPPFRVGNGDITDSFGHRSGQSDIVIEYGNSISFPLILPTAPRLYLAEGVCAVIEVKSNLSSQWEEVKRSHGALAPLQRSYSQTVTYGTLSITIPHFAVGYRGWKTMDTLQEKAEELDLEGILVLDSGLYYGKKHQGTGIDALFAFFMTIQALTGIMLGCRPNYTAYR